MPPSADMPDAASQDESFSLAKVVPGDRDNNRFIWADIEQTVQRIARANGTIYVVTGPIISSALVRLQARVAVPVALYKAVYVPGHGAAAYISNNISVRNWRAVPVRALVDAEIDPSQDCRNERRERCSPCQHPLIIGAPEVDNRRARP